MYSVRASPDAEKQLAKLDGSVRVRVVQKIDALAENPRPPGCKKLKGDDNLWRVRAGESPIPWSRRTSKRSGPPIRIGVEEAEDDRLPA